jgi:hypothetical protein
MKQYITNKVVIWKVLGLVRCHSSGRWDYEQGVTKPVVIDYLQAGGYRRPSRAYPMSYFTALLTAKFAKYLVENDPESAKSCGLIVEGVTA